VDLSRRWSAAFVSTAIDFECILTEFSIAVIESLDAFSDDRWVLRTAVRTRMYGSAAQHTAWVIDRTRAARPFRMSAVRASGASHSRFPARPSYARQ
jgi:hypothetical protein